MNCLNHTVSVGLAAREQKPGLAGAHDPSGSFCLDQHVLCPHTSAAALRTELRALGGGCLLPTQDHRPGRGRKEVGRGM